MNHASHSISASEESSVNFSFANGLLVSECTAQVERGPNFRRVRKISQDICPGRQIFGVHIYWDTGTTFVLYATTLSGSSFLVLTGDNDVLGKLGVHLKAKVVLGYCIEQNLRFLRSLTTSRKHPYSTTRLSTQWCLTMNKYFYQLIYNQLMTQNQSPEIQ